MQPENQAAKSDGIVVPPGCDNPMLHHCGESVSTYTPSSYTPFQASQLPIPIQHPMHGKSTSLSISKDDGPMPQTTMSQYLSRFLGAHLCLDLWLSSQIKIKKCGILTEIGKNFIVLTDKNCKNFSVIDLKPVRYLNIYCR